MKKVIAEISHSIILYTSILANPKPRGDERQDAALQKFLVFSAELQACMHLVPFYKVSAWMFGLPKRDNIMKASQNLIGLYHGHDNAFKNQAERNLTAVQHIRSDLGIPTPVSKIDNPDLEIKYTKAKGS